MQLQHLEGLTQTAVAQRLGVPVGTVKSRSYRAHKKLAGAARATCGRGSVDAAECGPPAERPLTAPTPELPCERR